MLGAPDIVIVCMILVSILIGIFRGFIKEFISLLTWIVAIVMAIILTTPLSGYMTFTKIEFVRMVSAFLLIFVGVVFLGAMLNLAIGSIVRKTPFSLPDRILGALFGLLRGVVLVVILVLLAGLTTIPQESWWQQSKTVTRFQLLATWLKEKLPKESVELFHFTEKKQLSDEAPAKDEP